MSTVARQIIGEGDEDLRRLAMNAIFPPEMQRMRRIKTELEAAGVRDLHMYQRVQYDNRTYLAIGGALPPPPTQIHERVHKFALELAKEALGKAEVMHQIYTPGFHLSVRGPSVTQKSTPWIFTLSMELVTLGKFEGELLSSGKFTTST